MAIDKVARGLAALVSGLAGRANAVSYTVAQNIATNARDATPFPVALLNPNAIAGLTGWWDAQQPVYTASYAAVGATLGDQISIWPDRSGNGKVMNAIATKPTYDPTGINGHPSLNFNGNSYMKVTSFFTTAYNTAFTMIVVAAAGSLAANKIICGTSAAYIARNGSNTKISSAATNLSTQPPSNTLTSVSGIAAWTYDGTNITYMDDSVLGTLGLSASAYSSKTPSTGNLGLNTLDMSIGGLPDGTFLWPDRIGEVLVFNAALTDEQFREVYAYLAHKWGYCAKPLVIFTGDSLTSGTGSSGGATQALSAAGTNLPNRVYNLLGVAADVRTDAYPGRTIAQVVAETLGFSDLMNFPEARRTVNHMAIGSNTLAGTQSLASTLDQYVSACKAKRAKGEKVCAVTLTPRQDSVYAGFEIDRLAFNAYLRANYTTFADGLSDVGAIANLQNPLNTTYFNADKVHLTDAGYALEAPVSYAAITPLLV